MSVTFSVTPAPTGYYPHLDQPLWASALAPVASMVPGSGLLEVHGTNDTELATVIALQALDTIPEQVTGLEVVW